MFLATSLLTLLAAPGLADLGPVPAGTLRVFLVRHGQAFSNLDPEPDLPAEKLDRLTDLGHAQARAAGSALAGRGIVMILTSPAGRARETAEEIRRALSAPAVRVEPRLRPLDLGRKADGSALDWDDRIASWDAGQDPTPPGGESLARVGERVLEVLREAARAHPGASLVAVAHGEVIGSFLGLLDGTPPAKRYPPDLKNASITVVDVAPDGAAKALTSNVVPGGPARP